MRSHFPDMPPVEIEDAPEDNEQMEDLSEHTSTSSDVSYSSDRAVTLSLRNRVNFTDDITGTFGPSTYGCISFAAKLQTFSKFLNLTICWREEVNTKPSIAMDQHSLSFGNTYLSGFAPTLIKHAASWPALSSLRLPWRFPRYSEP